MSTISETSGREARVRKQLWGDRGLVLKKSRAHLDHWRPYRVLDPKCNVVIGGWEYGAMALDELEEWLSA